MYNSVQRTQNQSYKSKISTILIHKVKKKINYGEKIIKKLINTFTLLFIS